MRDLERSRTRAPLPTLAEARAVKLMGQPASWDGNGGKPLEHIPDGVLKKARAWFKRTAMADAGSATAVRMRAQCNAIDVVMHDRDAHKPQMELLPEIDARPTLTDAELVARVQAPDENDGLPF